MPQANAKHSAWVISWYWFSETRKPRRLLLYFLPAPWATRHVIQHMKYLYVNSELCPPSQRVPLLTEGNWNGLLFEEGPRILIGDDPFLVGCCVQDLRIEFVDTRTQIVRWTQPAGLRPKPRSSTEPQILGKAVERALEISTGEVKELDR
jgi:hypothetical protein